MMWNFNAYKKNVALVSDNGTSLTYGQLEEEGLTLAHAVGERCLVFLMCTNSVGSVLGYTAFLQNKIVPVLLSSHLDQGLLSELMEAYRPDFIWAPNDLELSAVSNCLESVYNRFDYCLLKTSYDEVDDFDMNLGLLLTTSGSTGSQKFVRQSYKNIFVNTQQIVEYLELNEKEKPVTTLPMNYTYGCSIINSHLLVGATILLTDKTLMDRKFWSFMKEQGATSFGGVPYTYEMLEKLRFFKMDLPQLKYMTQAGGKLSPDLHKKFAEYAIENDKKFIVMYGACEATARMGYLPAERALEKYGSCGIAIPGGRFYLLDENEEIIEDSDVIGELVYEGENVTMGYAECRDDLAKGDERCGVLYTGDMARRDADGYYYIVGRKKRFLKIFGNRVNLDEIDILIKEKFGSIECASSGKDDHMMIFITSAQKVEDVKKYISDKTRLNPIAFEVRYIDELPKNESGKVLYTELQKTMD